MMKLFFKKISGPILSMQTRAAIRRLQNRYIDYTFVDSSDWTGRDHWDGYVFWWQK